MEGLTENDIHYINKFMPHLYILTPCYGNVCTVNYVSCLMKTVPLLEKWGIGVTVEFCKNDSLVTRARNNLMAKAMANPCTTHILFIDSDITWKVYDIVKLIVSDSPLIGGIYPLKKYNWKKLFIDTENPYNSNVIQQLLSQKKKNELLSSMTDEELIRCSLVDYNVNYINNALHVNNNITQVKHIPTGFMMIQRKTIETMMETQPLTKYKDDVGFLTEQENEFAYALFNCAVVDGRYLSEDWYFCENWTATGGEISVDISINLNHTGNEEFIGSYVTSLLLS
jgi:hypothetical protein